MILQENFRVIEVSELIPEVTSLKQIGYNLVAITCTYDKQIELTYSFEKENEFLHLRILTDTETIIQSVSGLYVYAFLYENEIKELFDVKLVDIVIDFDSQLYLIAEKAPFVPKKEES